MRIVHNLLVLGGATALGAFLFALAGFGFLVATDSGNHGHNDMSGAGLVIVFVALGGALGAVVGFIAGVVWVMMRGRQRRPARGRWSDG